MSLINEISFIFKYLFGGVYSKTDIFELIIFILIILCCFNCLYELLKEKPKKFLLFS